MTRERLRLVIGILALVLVSPLVGGCFLQRPTAHRTAALFDLKPGQIYGPVMAPPIFIRLGQSLLHTTGTIGTSDDPSRSPTVWEGHALALESVGEQSRTLYFYVQGDDLRRVTLQISDQDPIVDDNPGAYLSGEFAMVRWKQNYSLRVAAEDGQGNSQVSTIFVDGEDAHIENEQTLPPLNMKLMRLGKTETRVVRGLGYQGKINSHAWPACGPTCDPSVVGGTLVAMVSGPTDSLAVILNEKDPNFATGLGTGPLPDFIIVAIPVRDETMIQIAALSEAGHLVRARWDRPSM